MGPDADVWRLQLGGIGLLCDLLCIVPCSVSKAPQIRNPVSCSADLLRIFRLDSTPSQHEHDGM